MVTFVKRTEILEVKHDLYKADKQVLRLMQIKTVSVFLSAYIEENPVPIINQNILD